MGSDLSSLLLEPLFAESAPCATLRAKPLGFVDIGARGGAHPLVEPIAGLTAVLGFEPDVEECDRLNGDVSVAERWAKFHIEPIALAEGDGVARLHFLSTPTNHSLLRPNLGFTHRYNMVKWQEIGGAPIKTTSLDKVLFDIRAKEDYWGEFVKLDTQGTEYEILRGAQRTIAERTVAIVSEVEFFQVMEGQKLFSEVEMFLRQRGFAFYGFATIGNRSCKLLDKSRESGRERLFYADAVFFRDPLPGAPPCEPLSERGAHVLFVCALLLGYYDFALELAVATWATGEEAKRIEKMIRKLAAIPVSKAYADVLELAQRVQLKPELANIEVGQFVDRRRHLADYNDIFMKAENVTEK
jgi:FkbM family methyltransferase